MVKKLDLVRLYLVPVLKAGGQVNDPLIRLLDYPVEEAVKNQFPVRNLVKEVYLENQVKHQLSPLKVPTEVRCRL